MLVACRAPSIRSMTHDMLNCPGLIPVLCVGMSTSRVVPATRTSPALIVTLSRVK